MALVWIKCVYFLFLFDIIDALISSRLENHLLNVPVSKTDHMPHQNIYRCVLAQVKVMGLINYKSATICL